MAGLTCSFHQSLASIWGFAFPDLSQRNPLRFPSALAIHMALIARHRLTPGPGAALRKCNRIQAPLAGRLSRKFRLSPPDFLTAKTKDPKHDLIC
jgi:hypothetical protein